MKLHIGAGSTNIPGWINIDNKPYPGVDRVLDVREGLPFEKVRAIFAEHFVEHLTLSEADRFLRECRKVLTHDGLLRLTTPNLDWVWSTHYRAPETLCGDDAVRGCLELNRAFHGWGHKFLYNMTMLAALLRYCGFKEVAQRAYGESDVQELRGLERHEVTPTSTPFESLLIVEAHGYASGSSNLPELLRPYMADFDAS